MAIYAAWQTAYGEAGEKIRIRPVRVDQDEVEAATDWKDLAELVFMFGQNDFQPRDGFYSVSVGDLIDLKAHGMVVVASCGFEKITPDQAAAWMQSVRDFGGAGMRYRLHQLEEEGR